MALVSPGLEVTITDESQYVSTAVGTVPFILLATEEDKLFNGSVAPGTAKENAGKLLAVTSQRDLVTNFGYPIFKQSATGSPLHGDPLNEYGLMAAYSALGAVNRAFIIRADIDLKQLEGTAARPIGDPANGTHWLDSINSTWGVFSWDSVGQSFNEATVHVLTSDLEVNTGTPRAPLTSVGSTGDYAVVATATVLGGTVPPVNNLFFKAAATVPFPTPTWVQVGSTLWQNSVPAKVSSTPISTFTPAVNITINTETVNVGANIGAAVVAINAAAIPGVRAELATDRVLLFVTSAAMSNGTVADGIAILVDGTAPTISEIGFGSGTATVYAPAVELGNFAQVPNWRETDPTPAPTGSVWIKTTSVGSGANMALSHYSSDSDTWTAKAAPLYSSDAVATYNLDPAAGGAGIEFGTTYVQTDVNQDGTVTYRLRVRSKQGATVAKGDVSPPVFGNGNEFTIYATVTGFDTLFPHTVTLGGTNNAAFAAAVLAANIPDVTAKVETDGTVSVTHKQGGILIFEETGPGTPLSNAGLTFGNPSLQRVAVLSLNDAAMASNFSSLVYFTSDSAPYTEPVDGTLWFYNSPTEIDIMVNETVGWRGYQNVANDARGYNLTNTDPAGPIISPIAPTTQSDESPLVAGDLWVDSGDLQNFPMISRWNGTTWVKIDNSDRITQNGIVFADARWDATGTTDTAAGAFTTVEDLLTSNYLDIDAPDYRLYPRGTLLFNLRRSGFNIKRFVKNYFNDNAFPDDTLPTVKSTWVTASGLKNNGAPYMGSAAQRVMVVKAMRAALDSSDTIREESFQFNLSVAPGFPELISNLVQLNTDRKETGFIIGDTPMDLRANVIDLTNWSTNATGEGLSTASPYLGVFYPSGLTNDLGGNTVMVPPSHMALRSAIKSDSVSYPWFSFAGTRRGLIDNATDIGYFNKSTGAFVRNGLNQGLRDALYPLNINPITLLPGVGLTNFGNKTRVGVASSLDRINVARLANYLRTIFSRVGDGFLFEPNDTITRNQIKQIIESALNDLIAKRGIYDYVVICDETNNDPGRIARNELYVDVAIEPMKSVEFIYIPIRLKNPGSIAAGV